jgi:putative transposase
LQKDTLLSMLCAMKHDQKKAYMDFVAQDESEEIARFYSLKKQPSILGSDSFIEKVKEKFRSMLFQEEIPASRDLAPRAEDIISFFCEYFKVTKEELTISRRGTENLPRDVAIFLVRQHCRETLAGVGQHFSISNYSTVSSVVLRIRARKDSDKTLQKDLEKITTMIMNSQEQT